MRADQRPRRGAAVTTASDAPAATETNSRLGVAFVLGTAVGGTAKHVSVLASGCRDAGLAVSAFGPSGTAGLFGRGITFGRVDIADRPRPVRDVFAIGRLRSGLRARRPDVVHAHGVRAGALAVVAVAGWPGRRRRPGQPAIVITVHNAPPEGTAARFVHRQLERVCARRADVVLCASGDLRARMSGLGASDARQFDVPAAPVRQPTGAQLARARADVGANGRPVVLAVGRLAPQKALDVLVDAAARWRHREPAPLTVIAGDGPLKAALADQAGTAGTEVLLLGARDDVPALLAVADVVVLPSRWEARALVLQEAMQLGRPIVATRVGGTPELTGPDGAVLVPPGDPDALAAAVVAVLDDQLLAARLGGAARTRSAAFPAEKDAVQAALTIYAQLAAQR
jgi:glycosyltransferase involved in cell wall biosynthesis